MPPPRHPLLRVLVPALVLMAGIGVAIAFAVNSSRSTSRPAPGAGAPQVQPLDRPPSASPAASQPPADPPAGGADVSTTTAPPPAGGPPLNWKARPAPGGAFTPVGDDAPGGSYRMRVEFAAQGAGVARISLADHRTSIRRDAGPAVVQESLAFVSASGSRLTLAPWSAIGLYVDGDTPAHFVNLLGTDGRSPWSEVSPGVFEATVEDEDGADRLRVRREFRLAPGSYDVAVSQRVENLTDRPVTVRWLIFGPGDLAPEVVGYGDQRRVRFGYLPPPTINPSRQTVASEDFFWSRTGSEVVGPAVDGGGGRGPAVEHAVWPNTRSAERGYELVWAGLTSRYFACAAHPAALAGPAAAPDKALRSVESVDRVLLDPGLGAASPMVLRLRGVSQAIAPGASAGLDVGMYAGPLSKREMTREDASAALLSAAGLSGLVKYNFGGMCGWCTFSWISGPLLALLQAVHDYVVFDWGVAIIVLVVLVRTALHPVNRWSQIRMQRFGKQMQEMAPKQKKLQEKYGHDRKRMQEEMARLWREEGVSPTGMLGCLPAFLQSPIWIALSAMLFFAIELRHRPAFYGLFQSVSGGRWGFLGDLSRPDGFVPLGGGFTLPLMGPITSVNVLPLVLGVVFYIHQKYITPPTTATLTPEQKQQQVMMKWMTVVLFPLMMYAQPSGLTLYFVANSTIAIFENRMIRRHINARGLLDAKPRAKGGPSFFERLRRIAEDQAKARQGRAGRPGSRPSPRPPGGPAKDPPRRFKDR